MYREVSIKEELPQVGEWVITIDENRNYLIHRINEDKSWTMRDSNGVNSPNNNLKITHWLKHGNQYLFRYHLSKRSDEGWGNLALVFASDKKEAEEILIKEKTISAKDASVGLAFSWPDDIKPDHIYCLNIN